MFQVFAAISGGYLIVLIFLFEVLDRIRLNKMKLEQNVVENVVAKADGENCGFNWSTRLRTQILR